MPYSKLQSIINEMQLSPSAIIYLLEQGIEVEGLKLETQRCTKSESIESRIKIIQGKQFVSLLIAAFGAG